MDKQPLTVSMMPAWFPRISSYLRESWSLAGCPAAGRRVVLVIKNGRTLKVHSTSNWFKGYIPPLYGALRLKVCTWTVATRST